MRRDNAASLPGFGHDSAGNNVLFQRDLLAPFAVLSGSLVIAIDANSRYAGTTASELAEYLYVKKAPGVYAKIERLEQLQGKIKITTPEAALAFVRLPTTTRTWHLFYNTEASTQLDVIDAERLPLYRLYGEELPLRSLSKVRADGFCGVLNHKRFSALRIPYPSIQKQRDCFLVERTVVNFVWTQGQGSKVRNVAVLRQKVGFDGSLLKLRSYDLPRQVITGANWSIPMFE